MLFIYVVVVSFAPLVPRILPMRKAGEVFLRGCSEHGQLSDGLRTWIVIWWRENCVRLGMWDNHL